MSDTGPKFSWLDTGRTGDLDAGCIGVALEADQASVRRCFNVDDASHRNVILREAWQMSESNSGNDIIQISSVGDAVVSFEPNGWHGVEEEIATALSRGGRYAAYFWNVNAVMQFVFAEGGVVRRDFDPLMYGIDGERNRTLPEEIGLPFPIEGDDPPTPGQASLALIERLTGVEITRAWLVDEPHPTYRINPRPHTVSA